MHTFYILTGNAVGTIIPRRKNQAEDNSGKERYDIPFKSAVYQIAEPEKDNEQYYKTFHVHLFIIQVQRYGKSFI